MIYIIVFFYPIFSCHILLPYLKTPSIGHTHTYTTTVQPNVCKLHSESLVTTILADMLHCLIEEASYTATAVATCVFVVPIRLSAGYIL